jgi:soluble lytic murein transglycosylase-like protein
MSTSVAIVSRAYGALKGTLALVGLLALGLLYAVPLERDAVLRHLPSLAAFTLPQTFAEPATTAAGPIQAGFERGHVREQRLLTEFIARRYRVAEDAVSRFVATAYQAGAKHSVDPLLILAVMAIESRYNPVAQSHMGAMGLMQIIPKFHMEKLSDHGGEQALLDPEVNIVVGAQILREYSRRFGDLQAALQYYAGAYDEPTAQYAGKVLAELSRLEVLRQRARRQQA